MNILTRPYLGNTLKSWLIAVGAAVLACLILAVLKRVLYRKAKHLSEKTATEYDDLLAELIRQTRYFFLLLLSVYWGSKLLRLPPATVNFLAKLLIIAVIFQGAIWGAAVFEFAVGRVRAGRKEAGEDVTKYTALSYLFRLVLATIVILLTLDNLGVKVTALVAGLGIGGIAVALAVQNILGDLFASLSIVMDKPFAIGDFIIIDGFLGTVEHIGLKTTRLAGLGGEQLIFANNDLLKSRIRNFKRMRERRIVFKIGVVYETPADALERIPGIIREIIEAQDRCRFDRCHFASFGDFSLNFETVYFVTDPDYTVYMNAQQAINLELVRRFEKEGISFAYPTQWLYVKTETAAPPSPIARREETGERS